MTGHRNKAQRGYALLLMLLLLMGAGGIALAGFTQTARQEAEEQRYLHNQRVLEEAKQALLMYAYSYPEIAFDEFGTIRGPGRLPCPDTDDPVGGVPDGLPNASFNCINGTAMVGRFPYNDPGLKFYEALDASGEHLWYAVSSSFANTISPAANDIVNSDTRGNITLVDQSGAILYDGAANGLAAVIIAPGPWLYRDEDDNGTYEFRQRRGTNAQQGDPRNYLDTFNGFDNRSFVNGSNADADSFILGPVFDVNEGVTVVNDQMIIVTAEEVIAMAEKKVLETYRDAIDAYLGNTGGQYPWLYNYVDVPDQDGLQTFYRGLDSFTDPTPGVGERVTYLGNRGRVPSMFSNYFAAEDSASPIESKLEVEFTLTYPTLGPGVDLTGGAPTPALFDAGAAHSIDVQTANVLTNVQFVDRGGDDGRLSVTAGTTETFTQVLYFWDDEDAPDGYFKLCPADGDELSDCHRTSGGIPNPGGANDDDELILRVELTFEIAAGPAVEFDADFASLPAPVINPADANGHAWIEMTIPAIDVVFSSIPVSATYEYDDDYDDGESFEVEESGTLDVSDLIMGDLTLGLRYYPVLPQWALDNDWHETILMAYGDDYRPNAGGGPCDEVGGDCLDLLNIGGNADNKVSLLVIAGDHNWTDIGSDGLFTNDLPSVFDAENDASNDTFDVRGGDDTVLVIEEL